MPLTNFANGLLNKWLLSQTALTAIGTIYVGLSATTPTPAGGNFTEPSGNGYARVAMANTTTNWHVFPTQPSAGQEQSNATVVTFPTVTGTGQTWGLITYFGIFDAATAGNLLGYGALSTAQTPNSGATLSFAADTLTCTLA